MPITINKKNSYSIQKNDFFLIHFNVRSLSENKDKIEECLNDMTRLPDAIAISMKTTIFLNWYSQLPA